MAPELPVLSWVGSFSFDLLPTSVLNLKLVTMPVGKCRSSNIPRPGPCAQDSASKRERGHRPETIGVIQSTGARLPHPCSSEKHCFRVCKEKAGYNPCTPFSVWNGLTSSLGQHSQEPAGWCPGRRQEKWWKIWKAWPGKEDERMGIV